MCVVWPRSPIVWASVGRFSVMLLSMFVLVPVVCLRVPTVL